MDDKQTKQIKAGYWTGKAVIWLLQVSAFSVIFSLFFAIFNQ